MHKWTEIICILDRSGSMMAIANDTIGGFNAFVEQQQAEEGRARLTLVLFDNVVETPWEHIDIESAPKLDEKTYFVRGGTALLDAVGATVSEVRGRIAQMHADEKPDGVLVLVMTDGHENQSSEYSLEQVRNLIKTTQDEEDWGYVFIGADIDAFAAGGQLGVAAGGMSGVCRDKGGTYEAYSKMSRAASSYRSGKGVGNVDEALSNNDRLSED